MVKEELKCQRRMANWTVVIAIATMIAAIATGGIAYQTIWGSLGKSIKQLAGTIENPLGEYEHELIITKVNSTSCKLEPLFREVPRKDIEEINGFSLTLTRNITSQEQFQKYINQKCRELEEGENFLIPRQTAYTTLY